MVNWPNCNSVDYSRWELKHKLRLLGCTTKIGVFKRNVTLNLCNDMKYIIKNCKRIWLIPWRDRITFSLNFTYEKWSVLKVKDNRKTRAKSHYPIIQKFNSHLPRSRVTNNSKKWSYSWPKLMGVKDSYAIQLAIVLK